MLLHFLTVAQHERTPLPHAPQRKIVSLIIASALAFSYQPVAHASPSQSTHPSVFSTASTRQGITNHVNPAELLAAKREMNEAFKDRDAVAKTLHSGEAKRVGEYRGYGAYVTRTTNGQMTVALGDPNSRQRGVCHFAVPAALVAVGVAGVAALIAAAPEGATAIFIGGYEVPMEVAEAFVEAGKVTTAIDGLIAAYIC